MLKILNNGVKEIGYDIKDEAKLASIFGIGNGYFGIRGSFEEFGDVFVQGCYIRGVFDQIVEIPATFADNEYMKKYYFDVQKLKTFEYQDSCINIADPTTIKFYVGGKLFLPWDGKIVKWERYIDYRTGGLIRHVIWDDGEGHLSEFKFEKYCSFANNHLFFQKASVKKINHNLNIEIKMGIDTLVKTNGQHKSHVSSVYNAQNHIELMFELGNKYNASVALSSHNYAQNCQFISVDDQDLVYTSKYIVDGDYAEVKKVVAMYASVDHVDNISEYAKNDSQIAYEKAFDEHLIAYKKSFNKVDIKVKGNAQIDTLLRYANYQTLIGFDRYDSVHSLSAKNLTAEKYNQFVWWDAEIFQLPFLIYTHPNAARSCLEYRYRCLQSAYQNAKDNGCEGAKFAFCSSVLGDEKVWEYARHPFLQIHISSDVAYGIYNYFRATNDTQFMLDKGMLMMVEVCKYFYSRGSIENGLIHLRSVTGTDEHHPYVDDNAYTNYEVSFIANKTLDIAKKLEYSISDEDIKKIEMLAHHMYLQQPDKHGVIPQFEGYLQLKPYLPLAGNGAAKGFQMKASGLYHKSQIIKQPDVLNLFTYLDVGMPQKVYKANWKYYEKMCEASSSLTFPVHTISAIDNREYDKFLKLLTETLTIDINDIHNCAYQGVHAGCLAGGWYAIFRGLFGIKPQDDYLLIEPSFNDLFTDVKINFTYKNIEFTASINNHQLILKSKGNRHVCIMYKGNKMLHTKVSVLNK